jgi:hypothetical protein
MASGAGLVLARSLVTPLVADLRTCGLADRQRGNWRIPHSAGAGLEGYLSFCGFWIVVNLGRELGIRTVVGGNLFWLVNKRARKGDKIRNLYGCEACEDSTVEAGRVEV